MATLYEFCNTGDTGGAFFRTLTGQWRGQQFTPQVSHTITLAKVKLWRSTSSLGGNIILGIRATSGGLPTGSDLATGSILSSALGVGEANASWHSITLGVGTLLTALTMYAIALRCDSGDAVNFPVWRRNPADVYTGGNELQSTNGGVTWSLVVARDFMFEDWGDPVVTVLNNYSGGFANAKRLTRMRGW